MVQREPSAPQVFTLVLAQGEIEVDVFNLQLCHRMSLHPSQLFFEKTLYLYSQMCLHNLDRGLNEGCSSYCQALTDDHR